MIVILDMTSSSISGEACGILRCVGFDLLFSCFCAIRHAEANDLACFVDEEWLRRVHRLCSSMGVAFLCNAKAGFV